MKIPKGGNQNPYMEEKQTTQWPKEKGIKEQNKKAGQLAPLPTLPLPTRPTFETNIKVTQTFTHSEHSKAKRVDQIKVRRVGNLNFTYIVSLVVYKFTWGELAKRWGELSGIPKHTHI